MDRLKISIQNPDILIPRTQWAVADFETKDGKTIACFRYYRPNIVLKYFPGADVLHIAFNPSVLLYGNNLYPLWVIPLDKLLAKLRQVIGDVIYLDSNILENSTTNYYELNIDIRMTNDDFLLWLEVLSKTDVARRKMNATFIQEGTISFYSGKSFHRAGIVIIIYNKLKQQHDEDKYDSELTNALYSLADNEIIVRVEVKQNKANSANSISRTMKQSNNSNYIPTFNNLVNVKRELCEAASLLTQLHLDKKVLTYSKLISFIKSLNLGKTLTSNIISTIRYKNGYRKKPPATPQTMSAHIKLLHKQGIHHITSSRVLTPISLYKDVIDELPEEMRIQIHVNAAAVSFSKLLDISTKYQPHSIQVYIYINPKANVDNTRYISISWMPSPVTGYVLPKALSS